MKKVTLLGLICLTVLISNGCQHQKLWYLFLNCFVDITPNRFQFKEEQQKLTIPIVSSGSLDETNQDTTHLIVIIHGGD